MVTGREDIAGCLDHTLLRADARGEDIRRICEEAVAWGMAAVCVPPVRVREAAAVCEGSGVRVCTVVGFPLGNVPTGCKEREAEAALSAGATELDIVMQIGWARDGRWEDVRGDIARVVDAARGAARVKVIIEACLLGDDEKHSAALCALDAGADFVKTSTGMSPAGGARVEDVRLLYEAVGAEMGIKAAGGIRTLSEALSFIGAGATRIGTSQGAAIAEEARGGA